jgi:hypothetical protein
MNDAELAAAVQGLQGELTTALENYYTKTEIDGMFSTLRGEIADLDVGAIEGRVDALETAVETTIPGLINGVDAKFADYTKTSELDAKVDELGYAKVSELPTKISELENDVPYLVAADIAGKADSTQVAADIATAVAPLATTEALNALAGTHATDKAALEAAIALKADKSVVEAMYTNAQIDELLAAKQDTIPAETYDAFGAAAAAETAAKGYADQKLLDFENAYIKADDNSTIDKLNEIAAWIADDEAGAVKIIADVAAANTNASNAVSTANTASSVANEAKGLAEAAVSTANNAKSAATEAQNSAAASASAADASAQAADASAQAADASAQAAAESNRLAGLAQSAAEQAKVDAEAAKAAAAVSENNAAASASAAATDAEEAGKSAAAALASESAAATAKDAAEEAQGKAEAAQEAAEAARDAAVAAKEAAENSNTSATAIANAAKAEAEAATAASNAATEAVAGLHAVATSGSIYDLVEANKTEGGVSYLIFNCGSATEVI